MSVRVCVWGGGGWGGGVAYASLFRVNNASSSPVLIFTNIYLDFCISFIQ